MCFKIYDYSIIDVLNIIDNFNENCNIRDTRHSLVRNNQRNKDINIVYDSLLNGEIVGIIKQDYAKFKIYYEHPTEQSKDLVIVLVVNSDTELTLVTMFIAEKIKRWKK